MRKAGIIIPTLNEAETIGELIDSLLEDPYPKEILVVDSGSSDGTEEIARSRGAEVQVLRKPERNARPTPGTWEPKTRAPRCSSSWMAIPSE